MNNRETHQDYQHVIAQLGERYRLIECYNNFQWILQRKDKTSDRWRGRSFFLDKQSMIRVFETHGFNTALIDHLPDRFESQYKTVHDQESIPVEPKCKVTSNRSAADNFSNKNSTPILVEASDVA